MNKKGKWSYKNETTSGNAKLCMDRGCIRKPVKGTPFCDLHQPVPKEPIDPKLLKRMTARR